MSRVKGDSTRAALLEEVLKLAAGCVLAEPPGKEGGTWRVHKSDSDSEPVHIGYDHASSQELWFRIVVDATQDVTQKSTPGSQVRVQLQLCDAHHATPYHLSPAADTTQLAAHNKTEPAMFVVRKSLRLPGIFGFQLARQTGSEGFINHNMETSQLELGLPTGGHLFSLRTKQHIYHALPSSVYMLRQPFTTKLNAPVVLDTNYTCSPDHRGCCAVNSSTTFRMPAADTLGPAAGKPYAVDVAAYIVTGVTVLHARLPLLYKWLLGPLQRGSAQPWSHAIIGLDAYSSAINSSLKKTDWVCVSLSTDAATTSHSLWVREETAWLALTP